MSEQRYILKDRTPVAVDDDNYWLWKEKLPVADQTTLCMRILLDEYDDVAVSTVFLGIAAGKTTVPTKPLVFETFVKGGKFNRWCKRYTTFEDAVKGHSEVARRVKESVEEETTEYDLLPFVGED